ncbi:unnamed protein product, partial [Discosporangium mesarthrocarpum]
MGSLGDLVASVGAGASGNCWDSAGVHPSGTFLAGGQQAMEGSTEQQRLVMILLLVMVSAGLAILARPAFKSRPLLPEERATSSGGPEKRSTGIADSSTENASPAGNPVEPGHDSGVSRGRGGLAGGGDESIGFLPLKQQGLAADCAAAVVDTRTGAAPLVTPPQGATASLPQALAGQ